MFPLRDLFSNIAIFLIRKLKNPNEIICPHCNEKVEYKKSVRVCRKCSVKNCEDPLRISRKVEKKNKRKGIARADICPLCREIKLNLVSTNNYFKCKECGKNFKI